MQIENWQDIAGKLIHDDYAAIIVDDDQDLSNQKALQVQLKQLGQPVDQVRKVLIKNNVKRQLKTDPLKLSSWFNRHQDGTNAKKTEKLIGDQATHQYQQIKNELAFFGESFLEGFLGFYSLEINQALSRYESRLHVLETQELGHAEKEYYLANSQNGHLKLATEQLPSRQLAEEQLNKFYARKPEQEYPRSREIVLLDEDHQDPRKEN
ncbi:hypothetical protein NT95_01455 [Oenococcus kitaharae]|uniref:hypothetical protein n=1 Tax=Oenococcus kitaharae TaxID=336988 RepID=UPI0008631283|nr:hypothetical protein [Oenococcus kitaharae]OEY84307.1 hypothetical protein NT95_01455 [Oenococcus kitaharae]